MEHLAELFSSHFSLTPLLTTDFSLNHKNFYLLYLHVCKFCTYRNKLDSIQLICDEREPNSIHQIRLQLLPTDMIGTLNQIDQFENINHLLKLTFSLIRIYVNL